VEVGDEIEQLLLLLQDLGEAGHRGAVIRCGRLQANTVSTGQQINRVAIRWWRRGERCQLRKEHNARTMVGLWRNLAGNHRPFSDVIADLDRWTTSPPSLFPACRSAAAMSDFDLFGILCLYYLPLFYGSEKEIAIVSASASDSNNGRAPCDPPFLSSRPGHKVCDDFFFSGSKTKSVMDSRTTNSPNNRSTSSF
jgi:hypothetical protein